MDNDLMRLRAQIDLVDQQILDLLSGRLKMAEQVGEAKSNSSSVFRPDREAQLLARLCAAADPSFSLSLLLSGARLFQHQLLANTLILQF